MDSEQANNIIKSIDNSEINSLVRKVHKLNEAWWKDPATGEKIERNKGEQIALIHSELSEALEGVRKGLMDDHLPELTGEEAEMADTVIRIFDYCGGHGIDLGRAMVMKLSYNASRADHKPENRVKEGGKKF